MGISYTCGSTGTHIQGECPGGKQEVMLRVALEDPLGDPVGGKGGKRGAKIGSMSKGRSSLALEKGRFKHTEHC